MNDNGLHATLFRDFAEQPTKVYVGLVMGTEEVASWDVTARAEEFEQQPGDYWSVQLSEAHEQGFADRFVAEKLRQALGAAIGGQS